MRLWRLAEESVYGFMIILLTGAFLSLWSRVTFETGSLATVEGDPLTRNVLLVGYSVSLLLGARFAPGLLFLLRRSFLLVALLFWALLSTFWSEAPEVTFRKGIAIVLATSLAFILVIRFNFRDFIHLMSWAFLIVLGASLLAVVVMPEIAIVSEPRGEPWRGVFVQKNILGNVALLGSLVFTWQVFVEKRLKGLWLTSLFLALFLLYKSDSRTTQVVLLALLSWIGTLWLARRVRRVWPAVLAGLILVVGSIGVTLLSNLEAISTLTGRDLTLTGRVPLWEIVWSYIQERPLLGYGFGSFWLAETYGLSVSALAGWEVPHSHNGFLDLWLELGVVGLALGVFLLLTSLVFWFRAYLKTGLLEALFWATMGGFFILYNFSESGFLKTNNVLWLLLTLMYLGRTRWTQGFNETSSQKRIILHTGSEALR